MAMWKYTIRGGSNLRNAIYEGDTKRTIECLIQCFDELWNKLSKEDLEEYDYEIEDIVDSLGVYVLSDDEDEDTENINEYLRDFFDICDDVRAFVTL